MRSTAEDSAAGNLRLHLRAATMAAHDLLDAAMQAASGWQNLGDYTRFLSLQHAARVPVEAWLDDHAPRALRPPRQTPLIARDLAALGLALPPPAAPFALDAGKDSAASGAALGAAWVLAGSALGNRSILKQMQRASAEASRKNIAAASAAAHERPAWPAAFLGDAAMIAFWQDLRGLIERPATPAEAAAASDAAAAVFEHFIANVQNNAAECTL
ncbi:MAG: hypothetical protein ACXIT4_00850 [Erythrobacter sp.]